jgi:pyruvate-formate lyase-activating enzyme
LNCEIFKILYLRANGEVACNCGSGEKVNLGQAAGTPDWSATQLFTNPRYRHMEAAFQRGELPWGDACAKCVFLRPNEPFYSGFAEKRLEKIHVEPSLACALRCPGCTRIFQIKERKGPVFLPIPTWRRVLTSLRDEGYRVELFYFCGQGEPLSHPHIEDIVAAAREFFPGTPVVINTNGNYRFADVFPRGIYPDRILVSIDGLHQESYEQYRINGDVATALQFMRDAKHAPGRAPSVEWKYILFRYNDSDAELTAAQRHAAEAGIDSLQFVVTHTPEKSTRFTADNIEDLPIVWPNAYPETTPHLYFKRPTARALGHTNSGAELSFSGQGRVQIAVDDCRYWSGRLFLRGWAMDSAGRSPRALRVRVADQLIGTALLGVAREDVAQAYPQHANRTAGFNAACELPRAAATGTVAVTLDYETPDGATYAFTIPYDLSQTGAAVFNADCP